MENCSLSTGGNIRGVDLYGIRIGTVHHFAAHFGDRHRAAMHQDADPAVVSIDDVFVFCGVRRFDVVYPLHAAPLEVVIREHALCPSYHHLTDHHRGADRVFTGYMFADHCPSAFDVVRGGRHDDADQFPLGVHLCHFIVGPFTLHTLGV